MRLYKLMERQADDVFATLAGLLGTPESAASGPGTSAVPRNNPGTTGSSLGGTSGSSGTAGLAPRPNQPLLGNGINGGPGQTSTGGERSLAAVTAIQGKNFSIALDEHTNT